MNNITYKIVRVTWDMSVNELIALEDTAEVTSQFKTMTITKSSTKNRIVNFSKLSTS